MNDIREDIKAYLDGELSPDRMEVVSRAIASDTELQHEVNEMRQIGFSLRQIAERQLAPVSGAEKVLDHLPKRSAWWTIPQVRWGLGLAALVIGITVLPRLGGTRGRDFATMPRASVESPSSAPAGSESIKSAVPAVENRNSRQSPGSAALDGSAVGPGSIIPQLLIRTGDITVRVVDVEASSKQAQDMAKGLGGFIASSNISRQLHQAPTAYLTLRVPVKQFDSAMAQLAGLGELVARTTNSEDVTAQVADVEARLKVLRAEEDSYVTMLRAATKVAEMISIKERLSVVRQEIESMDAQRKALRNQSAYSTITCNLVQRPQVDGEVSRKDWSNDAWANAVNGLRDAGRAIGAGLIFLFVYAPIWLPVVGLIWWINRRNRR